MTTEWTTDDQPPGTLVLYYKGKDGKVWALGIDPEAYKDKDVGVLRRACQALGNTGFDKIMGYLDD